MFVELSFLLQGDGNRRQGWVGDQVLVALQLPSSPLATLPLFSQGVGSPVALTVSSVELSMPPIGLFLGPVFALLPSRWKI